MSRRADDRAERVRAELAVARGVARARRDRAARAAALALGELRELSTRDHAGDLERLRALTPRLAPGAASAPWHQWPAALAEPNTAAPGRLRFGTLDLSPFAPDSDAPADPVSVAMGLERFDDTVAPPALVPLLDAAHLSVLAEPDRRADAWGLVSGLLLRAIAATPAGLLHLSVYDPEHLGGGFAGFAPLAGAGLLRSVGPRDLSDLLGDLVEHVRRIHTAVLAGQYGSLAEYARATGARPEPWRVAVLATDGEPLPADRRADVARLVRTGAACGVHVVLLGAELPADGPAWTITLGSSGTHLTGAGAGSGTHRSIHLDPPPPRDLVNLTSRAVAERVTQGPAPARFADLLPASLWTETSIDGLAAPVGDQAGAPVTVALGDAPPHALIGGPSGSGKTNFLYAMIGSLTARYHPDELELYLLDFKEGVSFARFARGRKDPSWLPHAKLVGININEDREFGLALLRYLAETMRERAEAAKAHEATKLAELRAEDPGGRWPRIVAVVDEFQYLFRYRDQVSSEAVSLLDDLSRRGRSHGIHLILTSQDTSGIEALWGRSSIMGQFTLRVALPKARRVLADDNPLATSIPRWHAVVNPESGTRAGNQVARVPDAGARGTLDTLQARMWERRPSGSAEPRLFDGAVVPVLAETEDFRDLGPVTGRSAEAIVGQRLDVAGSAARVRMSRAPGRNLAVIGTRVNESCDVLAAATLSLARQHEPGTASFALAGLDEDARAVAAGLLERLRADGHDADGYDLDGVRDLLAATSERVNQALAGTERHRPTYVVLFAVDVANALLSAGERGRTGLDHLRRVVRRGPEAHTHVLGWWRTAGRLKDDLGGPGTRLEDIGAWLVLDAQGSELAPLPGGAGRTWHPRPRRGLFFDRSVDARPDVVIPFHTEVSR